MLACLYGLSIKAGVALSTISRAKLSVHLLPSLRDGKQDEPCLIVVMKLCGLLLNEPGLRDTSLGRNRNLTLR